MFWVGGGEGEPRSFVGPRVHGRMFYLDFINERGVGQGLKIILVSDVL